METDKQKVEVEQKKSIPLWSAAGLVFGVALVGVIIFLVAQNQQLQTQLSALSQEHLKPKTAYVLHELGYGISVKIPSNWTILSQEIAESLTKAAEELVGNSIGEPVAQDKLTLLAANAVDPDGAMVRININKDMAATADFQKLLSFSQPELREFDQTFLPFLQKLLSDSGIPVLKMYPSFLAEINGKRAFAHAYRRRGMINPQSPWTVTLYKIPFKDCFVEVTLSCEESKTTTLQPILDEIKNSIVILTPPEPETASTELGLFVRDFMLDVGYSKGKLPFWDIQSENPKIVWITDGTEDLQDGWAKQRIGYAVITANGKEFYALKQRKTIEPWKIELKGDKFGIKYTSFAPPVNSFGANNSGSDYDFEAALTTAGISFAHIFGPREDLANKSTLYKISLAGKKDALAFFQGSEGSGGSTVYLYLIYPEDEKIPNEEQCHALLRKYFW